MTIIILRGTDDLTDGYRQYDIIDTLPDRQSPGLSVTPPQFLRIDVYGLSYDQSLRLVESHEITTIDGKREIDTLSVYQIAVPEMSTTHRSQLTATGTITLAWAELQTFINNKITGMRG